MVGLLKKIAMSNLINCGAGCDFVLPPANSPDCPTGYVNQSEIDRIFVGKPGYAFNDWEDAAEWALRLNQTWQDPTAIRSLTVVGDKPAPEKSIVQISDGREVVLNKKHTLNADIDVITDENFNWVNFLECNPSLNIWFRTKGGYLFGGNDGIKVTGSLDTVLERGDDSLEKLVGAFNWKNKFSPQRIVSPV
jgi:hypothetical protein